MYTYFNNQPFLDSLSSQTSLINSLHKKQQYLTMTLCVAALGAVIVFIKMQQYRHERNDLRDRGYRLS
jgi:predicted lysophospholipase L1 biosynthesis ABC-type transport system permease subunit